MARVKKGLPQLLFVDANIWLDFYRTPEAALGLLDHLETIADKIIVTHQLEMEFKKNRQAAIRQGMEVLKEPSPITRLGLFSESREMKKLAQSLTAAAARVKKLKARMLRVLEHPTSQDRVFQTSQRIFHREDDLVLSRGDRARYAIRRQAFRRFILGCPPRKDKDTSIGDAINWEWMVACAARRKAELVIVSRDSDYGAVLGTHKSILNDHLRQEFAERVGRQRKIYLFSRLSDALDLFRVRVSAKERKAEAFHLDSLFPSDNELTPMPVSHSIIELMESLKRSLAKRNETTLDEQPTDDR